MSFLFSSTVLLANVTSSLLGVEHTPDVFCKSVPRGKTSIEHVTSTRSSAGLSSTKTALNLPQGARMKPTGGRIRKGETSTANVTVGPEGK